MCKTQCLSSQSSSSRGKQTDDKTMSECCPGAWAGRVHRRKTGIATDTPPSWVYESLRSAAQAPVGEHLLMVCLTASSSGAGQEGQDTQDAAWPALGQSDDTKAPRP